MPFESTFIVLQFDLLHVHVNPAAVGGKIPNTHKKKTADFPWYATHFTSLT